VAAAGALAGAPTQGRRAARLIAHTLCEARRRFGIIPAIDRNLEKADEGSRNGRQNSLFAVVGAAAVWAATTHGPISAVLQTMELTGRDRSFILPLLLAVVTATVVARTLDRRSIYDARLTEKEVKKLQQARAPSPS